ncbi:MAG: hypothetical protein ACE145_07785 [Terriglobia bacterium]
MAKVKDYWQGDLTATLNRMMSWMLSRLNANVSPFAGNAVPTPTEPALVEGTIRAVLGDFSRLAQDSCPNIVLDPVAGVPLDDQAGPDGFPINYSPTPLPSGNLFVNALPHAAPGEVAGRVLNLPQPATAYRVDVYSWTDVFYYQGSSSIADDGTWQVAEVEPGLVVAFLLPATVPQPSLGSWTTAVEGWVAHSNLGVGAKLRDYFVRVFSKTDIEYIQEDNIPLMVQDSMHARFGASRPIAPGIPTAHVIYSDPVLGEVDLYSTLQNLSVYSDLPRSIEVPSTDPDYAGPTLMTRSNAAFIQNRCWIYDAALAIIVFSVAGLWDLAARIVTRLNALRDAPGYLPSIVLESAEDGLSSRWAIESGAGSVDNLFDPTEPPDGSKVIAFVASTAPATWRYTGGGLPDAADSILSWRYKTSSPHKFVAGVTSSVGRVTSVEFISSGVAGYDPAAKKITVVLTWVADQWRTVNYNLNTLINEAVPGEALLSIASFEAVVLEAGELRLDNLSAGAPQPEGSLGFSYDVYNGQVDQAYIRNGAMAWVAYAYGIYIERTGDFARAALGLQSMLNYLFSQQSAATDARQHLITLGWGRYEDPGYQYIPGQLTAVSTEHNIDCYFAFDKATRVLPTAAQNLFDGGSITAAQLATLRATAATAGTKAEEVRAAILNQLWIPAAGGVKGHFAQGASSSGLDAAYALDASGAWAAMFAHEAGDDAKAVECLQFIFETFLLANQQIVKSLQPEDYNQAYEQLTPFDGFKPYADSEGGYSGSPDTVWAEGTWGALAALLRLSANSNVIAYFAAEYPGGLEALLARMVQSMKIVSSTTGDYGLLSVSHAARALPWEFAVRKGYSSTAWFWLTATRNDVLFSLQSSPLEGRPLLKTPRGVQQSVRQLEGQASIGALELEAVDHGGYVTALASGGKLEGREVALKVGYPGMASSDFVTLATQEIESVVPLPDLTGYVFECRDLKRSAKTKIFRRGDDGYPISNDHPRTLIANPIDVALVVLQNELGLGQAPALPESAWRLYDPEMWDAANAANPTLIRPNPALDVEEFLNYRNGIFAGYLFEFTFTQPVEAKQFLEYEIFRALGGYLLVLADGRLSPRFFLPPSSFANLFTFTEWNITVLPRIERHPIINQVSFRMDYDGDKFLTELLFFDAPSLQQFGLAGQHTIESKGLKLNRSGASLAALTATRIFRRYSGIDPVSGARAGGTPTLTVQSHFMTLKVEVGDLVFLSHPLLPNFASGVRGVFNRVFEVVEKQPNYSEGTMTFQLLDIGWVSAKRLSSVAPNGTPAYLSASSAERAQYMFVSAEATRTYSNGDSGKTVF